MRALAESPVTLFLDGGSPLLSIAVGAAGNRLATRSAPASRSSALLMHLLDECLAEADLAPSDLEAVVALRGPGSFTGLRVGLALAQGLRQALGVPAGTLSTFEALAAAADDPGRDVIAAVRAGRRDWHAQTFSTSPSPSRSRPSRMTGESLLGLCIETGAQLVAQELPEAPSPLRPGLVQKAPPLAGVALGLMESVDWDKESLTRPVYLSPPPADANAIRHR